MKSKNFRMSGLMAAALVIVGIAFNSCKDDEDAPVPVVVENPLEKEVYFITGKVTDGTNPLADATVAAGSLSAKTDASGAYQLEVSKKGDFELSFEKDGYLTIKNKVTIDSKADKGAIVACSQILTKKADPVTVNPAEESNINPNDQLAVTIPAGAVKEATEVTLTPFTPAADTRSKEAAEKAISSGATTPVTTTTAMSLASLSCEPDGIKFDKPVTVNLKAQGTSDGVYFTNTKHYVNGVEQGDATYDAATHSYKLTMDGFSTHEVKVNTDLSVSGGSTNLYSDVIDNIGNTASSSKKISFKMKQGWAIKSQSGGVTGDVKAKLMEALRNTLSSAEGVSEIEMSREAAVSGDRKMTVNYNQDVVTYTFKVETSTGTESIEVEEYKTVKQTLTSESGNMTPQHNK